MCTYCINIYTVCLCIFTFFKENSLIIRFDPVKDLVFVLSMKVYYPPL